MKIRLDDCETVSVTEDAPICNADGAVREVIKVDVVGRRGPDGEIYLDGDALAELDQVKARYEGILLPADIKRLRG